MVLPKKCNAFFWVSYKPIDADIVIAIHRLWKYGIDVDDAGNSTENQATLRILKHRSGDLGVVNLRFEGKYVRFSNEQEYVVESKMNSDIKPNSDFDKKWYFLFFKG